MKYLLLTPLLITCFSLPSNASLTLIHWYNKTGTGTDKPNYPNKNLRGRFNGEVIFKNDNENISARGHFVHVLILSNI